MSTAHLDQGVLSIHEDYRGLIEDLGHTSPSALASLNRAYPKHLLIAAASNLEEKMKKDTIPSLFERHGKPELAAFVNQNVLKRGYHTLFNWNDGKATSFFVSFGQSVKTEFITRLGNDGDYKAWHDSFMLLGKLRNDLVHNNYATQDIDKTPDEIFELYIKAYMFVDSIPDMIFNSASA